MISRPVQLALVRDRLQNNLTDGWKASGGGLSTCFIEAGAPGALPFLGLARVTKLQTMLQLA